MVRNGVITSKANLPALFLVAIASALAGVFFKIDLPAPSNGPLIAFGSLFAVSSLFYGYLAWNALIELATEDEKLRSSVWLELKPGMIGRFQGVLASCILMGTIGAALALKGLFA